MDLLQVPHHGSRRNSSVELYEAVTADNYLVSAKGGPDKPHPEVARLIAEARAGAAFDVWLTNEAPAFTAALTTAAAQFGCEILIHARDAEQPFIAVTFD